MIFYVQFFDILLFDFRFISLLGVFFPGRNTDDADSVAGGGGDSKNANEQEFKRVSAAYAWLDHNYFLRRRPPS